MRPKVIIFDLGGVFFQFDWDFFNGDCFKERYGISREKTSEFFHDGQNWHDYERGKISSKEFFERIKRKLGYPQDYQTFCAEFTEDMNFRLDEEIFNFYLNLKVKYGADTFWILSNINKLHLDYLMLHWPGVFLNFEHLFFSCKMGTRKPDPEIYDKILTMRRTSPYTCLFIDDTKENGEYPRQIQMPFIRFQGLQQLKKELRKYGIFVDN